jgi:CHAT domain-containing protein
MKYAPPRGQLRLGLMFLVIAWALSQWPSATSSMQQDREQTTDSQQILNPGFARAVETAGEETRIWQIQLDAGDYLRLVITSKQKNLKVKLIASDLKLEKNCGNEEKPLFSATSQKVMIDGEEKQVATYLFAASVSGIYELETSSLAAIEARVKYEVEIERLRPITANDRLRIDALRTELEGDVLLNKSGTMEEKRLALTKYKDSLALWRELGDRRSEARLLVQIGAIYRGLGDLHSTYNYHNLARQIAQDLGELRQVANLTISIGIIQRGWGETQQALDSFNKARQIFASLSDHFRETGAIQSIGRVYLALGELRLALGYFDQALQAFSAIGNTSRQCAVLNLIGLARRDLGEDRNALEYFQRALEIARKHGYLSYQEGVALGGMGRVYLNLGDREKAADYYNELLMMGRKSGDSRFIVDALHALGNISYLSGEKEKALDYLSQSLALYRRMGWRQAVAQTLSELARTGYSMGNLDQARSQIEEALEIKESMRINVSRQDLRASFFSSAQKDFDLYIDLLMSLHRKRPEAGYDASAFRASERARARGLLEQLTEINLDVEQGIDPKLQESARALQRQLNEKAAARANAFGGPESEDSKADSEYEITELTSRYQELEAQIRIANPRYAALTKPEPLTVTEIQKGLLDDETVLLEFALGEESSWLWAVTPQGILSRQLPPRSEIEAAARALYSQLTARQPRANTPEAEQMAQIAEADAKCQTAAQVLSEMLLGPIADSLLREWNDKRLLIVASGALQYLPFGALPHPSISSSGLSPAPLIATHEIVNLPSASVLDVIRRETSGRGPARKTLAVLADPVFEADDPRLPRIVKRKRDAGLNNRSGSYGRLPFSTDEADAIASFVPGESLLKATSFQASREKAMSGELAGYRIIHFATHGLLDSEHPELSGLVLSLVDQNGRSQDGFLRLHDIYNLRLPADTVVLSACQTALGKEIKGEGLIGLTRGFMYAGAQRVVASLWQVDDSATAALMTNFYRNMLQDGRPPAAALRMAQLEIMRQKRWSSPYFWAGFVIQGEWR